MINREAVEKYFCLMKSKQVITDYWSFDSYIEREDYIKIFFLHKSGKRSSYVFSKELVLQGLRDDCLRNLFD